MLPAVDFGPTVGGRVRPEGGIDNDRLFGRWLRPYAAMAVILFNLAALAVLVKLIEVPGSGRFIHREKHYSKLKAGSR